MNEVSQVSNKRPKVRRSSKNMEDGSQLGVNILNHKYNYEKSAEIHLVYKMNYSRKEKIITCVFTFFISHPYLRFSNKLPSSGGIKVTSSVTSSHNMVIYY
jgi:hypothetical protein